MKDRALLLGSLIFLGVLNSTTLHADENLKITSDSSSVDKKKKKNIFTGIIDYFNKTNEVRNDKKFDISFIGGPSYSGDTKFGIGLVASGVYRIDREDLSLQPSNVSIYGNFTTSGFVAIGVEGHTIFPKDDYRLDYDVAFAHMPSKYWGIGYDNGKHKHGYTKLKEKQIYAKFDFYRKIIPSIYVGVTATAQNINTSDVKKMDFLLNEKKRNTAIGGGFIVTYDSRDFIPNPYKGTYIKLEQNFYPNALGSSQTFNRFNFTARHYQRVWKGGILAFDFNSTLNNGNVPWNMMAQLGGSRQMRGYYKGKYRDKKMIDAQIELRQNVWRRSGVVLWAGAGNVFPDFKKFDWSHTLPTYGFGYRWEFKNRINVRLDYGLGKKGQSSFYFNINESF